MLRSLVGSEMCIRDSYERNKYKELDQAYQNNDVAKMKELIEFDETNTAATDAYHLSNNAEVRTMGFEKNEGDFEAAQTEQAAMTLKMPFGSAASAEAPDSASTPDEPEVKTAGLSMPFPMGAGS